MVDVKPFYKREMLEYLYLLREIESKSAPEALKLLQEKFPQMKDRKASVKTVYDLVSRFKIQIQKEMQQRAKYLVEEEQMKLTSIKEVLLREFAVYKTLVPSGAQLRKWVKEENKPTQSKPKKGEQPSRKLVIRKGDTEVEVQLSEEATLTYLRGLTNG